MFKIENHGGELKFKIQVKRKATGLVEEYDLVGKVTVPEEEAAEQQASEDFNHKSGVN